MDSKQERFKDAPKVMMEQASGREHEASTVSYEILRGERVKGEKSD